MNTNLGEAAGEAAGRIDVVCTGIVLRVIISLSVAACAGATSKSAAPAAVAATEASTAVCPPNDFGVTWAHDVFPGCAPAPYVTPFPVCSSGAECARPCSVSETFRGAIGLTTRTSKLRYDARGRFAGADGSLEYLWVPGFDRCSYDGDHLASCDYAGGGHETYDRDASGRLVRVHSADTWLIEWGPDGVATVGKQGTTARTRYTYDAGHRLVGSRYEGGPGEASGVTTYTYDGEGRPAKSILVHLTGITDEALRQRAAERPTFRYGADGRVTDDDHGIHYEWDAKGRLVRARAANVETIWAYDCSALSR